MAKENAVFDKKLVVADDLTESFNFDDLEEKLTDLKFLEEEKERRREVD